MRLVRNFCLALLTFYLGACGDRVEHQHYSVDPTHPDYERRLGELEQELGSLDETTRYQSEDLKLSHATVEEVQAYLEKLYANINDTKVEHLPDWQQMFDSLTKREAMFDPEFKIGQPAFQTNFFHQSTAITKNTAEIADLQKRMIDREEFSELHDSLIRDIEGSLVTINGSIEHINNTIADKFKVVDKILEDYNNRVRAIEERMSAVDTRVANVESQVGSFNSRIRSIEQKLATYDIASMDRNIRTMQSTLTTQGAQVNEIQGTLNITQGELRTTQDDLRRGQQDLARAINDLRQLVLEKLPGDDDDGS